MELSVGLVIASLTVTSCATVNDGTLTPNGQRWTRRGRITDKIGASNPIMLPAAFVPEPAPASAGAGTL